ncbi:MAG: PKD domain-containing protein [Bacteroidetes bacterium]|nr:PKD domain-containing protein [Bacteroidota bacterium]
MVKIFPFLVVFLLCCIKSYGQFCPNSDFSYLDFTNWEGFTGTNDGSGIGCCPFPGIVPFRHTIITTPMVDPHTCGGLTVPPPGAAVCARLGNDDIGAEAERLVYTFTVNPANPSFIYRYAVVLEDPNHEVEDQPFFSIKVLNALNVPVDLVCGYYEVYSCAGIPGFETCISGDHQVNWKDWTTVGINLSAYAGQLLHIEFTTLDCALGGHFGYAYILAECGALTIDQSFCAGSDSVFLTAPLGFSYLWSTGETTQSITIVNPPLGSSYYCNLTSVTGCGFPLVATISITVLYPDFTFSSDTCSRTVSFTGTSYVNNCNSFTSLWNFGDSSVSNQPDPVHTFPGQGTYNVTLQITTPGGCDSAITKTITIGDVPVALFAAHDTCQGQEMTFLNSSQTQADIIHWSWSFGDGSPPDTTYWDPVHLYTAAGNYSVTLKVTNVNGCTDSVSHNITIYHPPVPDFIISYPVCTGQPATLSFSGTASQGATFGWAFNGGTVLSGGGAGPFSVSWINPGIFPISMTVSDPVCGIDRDTVKFITVEQTPVPEAGNDTAVCLGFSVTLTGSGGNNYTWWPGESLSSATVSNPLAIPLITTTYHLNITENGCTGTDHVVVTVEQLSPVYVSNDTMICYGDSARLQASGGYHYFWSPATGLSATNVPDPVASPLTTTIYQVVIADSMGCQAIRNVKVLVSHPDGVQASFNIYPDHVCQNDIVIVFYNGTLFPNLTFTWNFNGATVISGSGAGPYLIRWPTTGTYNVSLTVSESNCNSDSISQSVTVNSGPIAVACPDDTICQSDNVMLSATGGVSYSWWPNTGLSNPAVSNPIASPFYTITYTVTVDVSGCTDQDQVTVWVLPSPPVSAGNDTSFCTGDSVTLQATGGISYLWSPSNGLNAANVANPVASPSSTTIYTVSGTDTNGCSATDMIMVTVNDFPTSSFTVDHLLFCLGDNVNVSYSGTGSFLANYTWNFDGATVVSGSGQGPYQINWSLPGFYTLSLVVDENYCQSSLTTLNVTVVEVNAAISSYNNVQCFGDNNGTATVTATGGDPPYAYLWNNLNSSPTIINLPVGSYSVTVTDSNGCSGIASVDITQPAAPLSLVTDPQNISCPYLCDGQISTSGSGGTSPYVYLWNTSPPQTASIISGLCPGFYTVTITDDQGCIVTESLSLQVSTTLDASCMADDTIGYNPMNVNFTYTGYGANSINWDFGDNTSSTLSNPLHIYSNPGIFLVTLIINSLNPDFCSDTTILHIYVLDTSSIEIPNVFTPNSDGYNDCFTIKSHYLDNCSVTIFDRWGITLFESNDINFRWRGTTMEGFEASAGTYYFILNAKGKDGRVFKKKGVVTLIR